MNNILKERDNVAPIALLLASNLEALYLDIDTSYKHFFNYSRIIKTIVNPTGIYSITSRHKRRGTLLLVLIAFAYLAIANLVYVGIYNSINLKVSEVLIKLTLIVHIAGSQRI